ncbi:MAG: hypothetical protein AAF211_19915 [Myxococcota bacterium]
MSIVWIGLLSVAARLAAPDAHAGSRELTDGCVVRSSSETLSRGSADPRAGRYAAEGYEYERLVHAEASIAGPPHNPTHRSMQRRQILARPEESRQSGGPGTAAGGLLRHVDFHCHTAEHLTYSRGVLDVPLDRVEHLTEHIKTFVREGSWPEVLWGRRPNPRERPVFQLSEAAIASVFDGSFRVFEGHPDWPKPTEVRWSPYADIFEGAFNRNHGYVAVARVGEVETTEEGTIDLVLAFRTVGRLSTEPGRSDGIESRAVPGPELEPMDGWWRIRHDERTGRYELSVYYILHPAVVPSLFTTGLSQGASKILRLGHDWLPLLSAPDERLREMSCSP